MGWIPEKMVWGWEEGDMEGGVDEGVEDGVEEGDGEGDEGEKCDVWVCEVV